MAEKWGTKYFENIQAESDDQNFVQQVNEEQIRDISKRKGLDYDSNKKWYSSVLI